MKIDMQEVTAGLQPTFDRKTDIFNLIKAFTGRYKVGPVFEELATGIDLLYLKREQKSPTRTSKSTVKRIVEELEDEGRLSPFEFEGVRIPGRMAIAGAELIFNEETSR